jgi:hypothetical protein
MDEVQLRLGSIPLRLSSNDDDFLIYSRNHFKPVILDQAEPPVLEVNFTLVEAAEKIDHLRSGFDKVGRGIFTDGETVIWSDVPFFPGLTVAVSQPDGRWVVDARYRPVRTALNRLKTVIKAVSGRAESKNVFYFELLYQLVYYPAFWACLNRGVHVLHGGGIEAGGRRIVIAGAQGTGKSTLIAHLLADSGSKFMSDNMVLFDKDRVLACHEPIRIEDRLLESVPGLGGNLEKLELDVPLGRTAYNVRSDACIESMVPEVFIVPRMSGAATRLTSVTRDSVVSDIYCFNKLADEVRSFDIFSSVVRQVFPARSQPGQDIKVLHELLDGKKLYKMNIKHGENPQETARALLQAVST